LSNCESGSFSDTAAVTSAWQSRVDLFRDVEAALDEDPASERCRGLARRWETEMERQSFGDAEIRKALRKAWMDRRNWSATLRWQTEAISGMDGTRFDKAATSSTGSFRLIRSLPSWPQSPTRHARPLQFAARPSAV
jgi:hypothetical protein